MVGIGIFFGYLDALGKIICASVHIDDTAGLDGFYRFADGCQWSVSCTLSTVITRG